MPDIGSGGRPSPPPVATAVAHLPASQWPPGLTPRGGSLGARSVVIVGLGTPVHAQAGHRAGARRADGDSRDHAGPAEVIRLDLEGKLAFDINSAELDNW